MKTFKLISLALILSVLSSVAAFPPAPHHLIYGVIKNEQGKPLETGDATVILKRSFRRGDARRHRYLSESRNELPSSGGAGLGTYSGNLCCHGHAAGVSFHH